MKVLFSYSIVRYRQDECKGTAVLGISRISKLSVMGKEYSV